MMAAEEPALRTRVIKAKILHTMHDPRCSMDVDDTISSFNYVCHDIMLVQRFY